MRHALPFIVTLMICLQTSPLMADGQFVEVTHGGESTPDWLHVNVTQTDEGVYQVSLNLDAREDASVAGYDLVLVVQEGSLKGLRIPTLMRRVQTGYSGGMRLPRAVLVHGRLDLREHLGDPDGEWMADGGSTYSIDLASYIREAPDEAE